LKDIVLLAFLDSNKEWLFSGALISVPLFVIGFFLRRKIAPSSKIKQTAGNRSNQENLLHGQKDIAVKQLAGDDSNQTNIES